MAGPTAEDPIAERMKKMLVEKLREAEPFMNVDAIKKCASLCESIIADTIASQQAAVQAAKEHIAFMSLPPEIRNRIYALSVVPGIGEGGVPHTRMIYVGHGATTPEGCDHDTTDIYRMKIEKSWVAQPALTRTTRQIRSEALPLYYGLNRFALDLVCPHGALCQWEPGSDEVGPSAMEWFYEMGMDNLNRMNGLHILSGFMDTCSKHKNCAEAARENLISEFELCFSDFLMVVPPKWKWHFSNLGDEMIR